jgi:hypothetical protein
MLENKLASVEKELQQAKKDNVALALYINARRKKEECWRKEEAQKKADEEDWRKEEPRKKAEEEARRKAMVVAPTSDEGQSFKDVQTWRK